MVEVVEGGLEWRLGDQSSSWLEGVAGWQLNLLDRQVHVGWQLGQTG